MTEATTPQPLPTASPDVTQENIDKLCQLFPEICTEGDGHIDFDKLKEILGGEINDMPERYAFTWPGKRDAIRLSQTPSTATLRPQREKSVNWDTTKNLYIEGDNLEVLKLLQRSYHGKVKLIYIDPPYNTGGDFVYKDSFGDSIQNYKEQTQTESQANPETDGRYHSNWCSMIYPRLRLARELLHDDGVIFVSIDDHELHTLRKIGEELFGEQCFVADISWQRTYAPRNDAQGIPSEVEHLLVWSKMPGWNPNKLARTAEMDAKYKNPDNDAQSWRSDNPFAPGAATHQGMVYAIQHPFTGEFLYPAIGRCWTFGQDQMLEYMNGWCEYTLEDLHDDAKRAEVCGISASDVRSGVKAIVLARPFEESKAQAQTVLERGQWPRFYFTKNGLGGIARKTYLDSVGGRLPTNFWPHAECGHTDEAKKEVKKLFDGNAPFDTPKPTRLLRRIIDIATNPDDLVMDFFSGSATTADALMQANAEDGGHRRYILVQLPELVSGEYGNLCDLGEERIRRAGAVVRESVDKAQSQPALDGDTKHMPDLGFRVLSLDTSNFERPQSGGAVALLDRITKDGRSKEDILFEAMLRWGLDLSLPIEDMEIDGYHCVSVAKGELICCLNDGLTVPVLEKIAALQERPRRVLMLDEILDDNLKLNAESIFGRAMADGDEIELRTV